MVNEKKIDDSLSLALFPMYVCCEFDFFCLFGFSTANGSSAFIDLEGSTVVQSQWKSIMSVGRTPKREYGIDTLSSELFWLPVVLWVLFGVLVLTLVGLGVEPLFQS